MSVRKDKRNNKWMYDGKYKDIFGNYKSYHKSGFDTKREAIKAESDFLDHATGNASSGMDLDELFHLYLKNHQTLGIKESTIYRKRLHYRNHIRDYFGNKKVKDINVPMVESWVLELIKKGYKQETVNSYKSILKSIMTYGVKIGVLQTNVVSRVSNYKNPNIINSDDHLNYWELDEFKKFISVVDDIEYKDIFNTLYMTGMRIGELEAIKWSDILFDEKKININKTTSIGSTGSMIITTPKTNNSIRKIDMNTSLYELLKERYERKKKLDGFTLDYFVFGDIRALNRDTTRNHLNKYIEDSGVKRITLHGFRHSSASLLISNGILDGLVANRLGHTVNELHKTYAHIFAKQRIDLIEKLDKIL